MQDIHFNAMVDREQVIRPPEGITLPEGEIEVTVRPRIAGTPKADSLAISRAPDLPPGVGLRRAFGAWAEDAEELDQFLEWNRQQRQLGRTEIEE